MPLATKARLAAISWTLLAAIVAAAVLLRFIGLDHLPGLNGDEAVFAVHAREWFAGASFSDLRGGTKRLMDPAFFGAVVLVNALLPATFWTIRLASVVHSLLAIALAFSLFRRRSVTFAAIFAALLAVLPIQLAYARLSWDPTAVPTVMLLALAAATRASAVWTALGFGLCLWTHPTTVFAAPIFIAALLVTSWPRQPDGSIRWPSTRALALGGLLLVAGLSLLYVAAPRDALPAPVQAVLSGGLPDQILERLTSPALALQFVRLYAEFITGVTMYRYVTGSMPAVAAALHVAGAVASLALVILPGLWRPLAPTRSMDRAVAVALAVSLMAAYLVGGLPVLEPGTERYGMFLVVPTCYVLAACIEAFAGSPHRAALTRVVTSGAGALLLACFVSYFLAPLRHADPARHNTYRTGDIEPKQAALAKVLAHRSQERFTVISAEDWWLYWPLRYLAAGTRDLHVTIEAWPSGGRPFPRDFISTDEQPAGSEVFGVAWAGSKQDAKFARRAAEGFDIGGYEPGTILRVHRLRDPVVPP